MAHASGIATSFTSSFLLSLPLLFCWFVFFFFLLKKQTLRKSWCLLRLPALPTFHAALLLKGLSVCPTLKIIQEKLQRSYIPSLKIVFVFILFASDTPSPQLPLLFYLSLPVMLKREQQTVLMLKLNKSLKYIYTPKSQHTAQI